MVHALREICRVLVKRGIVVDLRPLTGSWPMEVVSAGQRHAVGRVTGVAEGIADDTAANEAMRKAEDDGLLRREREVRFDFCYYWNSPGEMQEYIDEEWADFVQVEAGTAEAARRLWAVAEADARVSVRLSMLITRWQKAG